jgi:hypothetical protein
MRDVPRDFNVKKADGTTMTWEGLYEAQKQRMATIKHIDHLIVTIQVESVSPTDAVVLSTQDWSRVVPGPDGKDVRMITGITHREIWKNVGGEWRMEKFTEENPTRKVEEDAKITSREEKYEVILKSTEIVRKS